MSDKELAGKMQKLMARSKREVEQAQKKRAEEAAKNDPLAGESPAFRRLVSYAVLGKLFMDEVQRAREGNNETGP